MNAYTISNLARDAGVSVHVVRDYVLRGLLRPAARTAGGYGVFDVDALQRLCFVRTAIEAGVSLKVLTRLCQALDAPDPDHAATCLAQVHEVVDARRQALAGLELKLSALRIKVNRQNEAVQ